MRAAVIDADGEHPRIAARPTPHTERETEDLLVTLISKLAATQPVSAVGLAVAGFVSRDRQRIMFAPHLAWRDADVPARIAERVDLPVVMDHDVNSAAWAEYRRGAVGRRTDRVAVALGTGIGAGLVIDGEIYRGAHGVAPELGHLTVVPNGRPCPCGKYGVAGSGTARGRVWPRLPAHLMTTGDAPILLQLCERRPGRRSPAPWWRSPRPRVTRPRSPRWTTSVAGWPQGLALVTDVLDPEVIVVGGGVASAAGHVPAAGGLRVRRA